MQKKKQEVEDAKAAHEAARVAAALEEERKVRVAAEKKANAEAKAVATAKAAADAKAADAKAAAAASSGKKKKKKKREPTRIVSNSGATHFACVNFECGLVNSITSPVCIQCGTPSPVPRDDDPPVDDDGSWACKACTFVCEIPEMQECSICGNPRYEEAPAATAEPAPAPAHPSSQTIYLSGLPKDPKMSADFIEKTMFAATGVKSLPVNIKKPGAKTFCFVEYDSRKGADTAVAMFTRNPKKFVLVDKGGERCANEAAPPPPPHLD
jgi:hypothetical protein